MDECVALVTAVGGAGVGEQIVKALLRHPRVRVVGTDTWGLWPRFRDVDVARTLPPASAEDYLDAVLAVCEAHSVQMVFPGSEAELRRLVPARGRLNAIGVQLAACAPSTLQIALDKLETARYLESVGMAVPRTTTLSEGNAVPRDWFPVIVKPMTGGSGSRGCMLAQSAEELEAIRTLTTLRGSPVLIVQEYVGTADAEFTVGVLHDLDGNLVDSIALRRRLDGGLQTHTRERNRTPKSELGADLVISSGISHGEFGQFASVRRQCEEAARALEARGPLNVQCRMVEDRAVIFEVNPRFSGTTSLRALAGFNEPGLLIDIHLRGHSLPGSVPYDDGYILRSLAEDRTPERPAPA
ncbi:MAG TPA: ATP-grasp domain-containing protein, partial [Acidimicrobiales bacterium]|nr:ATP-grasp domain-containing protein [Acidimicrobiales bacterium]